MFEALLRGKLSRTQENMEDLLTSMVFGTLRRLEPDILRRFLQQARDVDGSRPLASLRPIHGVDWADGLGLAGAFWPWLEAPGCLGCEPDVLLRLQLDGGQWLSVLVEVKYRSGKSSFDDEERDGASDTLPATDQLAREWDNLKARARADEALVLYVTPSIVLPQADIDAAQRELAEKGRQPGRILWLSVRELVPVLAASPDPWARALEAALRRLGLVPFARFGLPAPLPAPWRFAPWTWPRPASGPAKKWRFSE